MRARLTRIFVAVLLVVGAGVAAVGARGADAPAPPTITAGPGDPTNSQTAVFQWAVQEGFTYQCRLDEAAFVDCTSTHVYSDLAEGSHTFLLKAIDAGVESDPASYTWSIDLTAPVTSIASHPTNPSNDVSPEFEFTSSEAGSTFECQLDGASFAACTSPESYTGLAPGSHTFEAVATDAAGNTDTTPASYTWTIDDADPNTTITASPSDPSNDVDPSFSFTSTEAGSTFECKLDSGSFATCVSPQSVSVSAGTHTYSVRATDEAGNVDLTPASYSWTVDTTAPATPQLRSPKPSDPSNDATPRFRWVVVVGVTYVCTVDETAEACTDTYTTDPLSEGPHTFELRAKDAAGNLSAPATWNWTVDLTPPSGVTGAADRAPDASGWYNHPVTVAFTSTDPTATCSSAVYSGPDNGSASVQGTCTDPAGNPAEATFALKFDATAPSNVSGAPTGTPINGWYASPVVVTFTGSDATSGIQSCTTATYSGPDGTGVSLEGRCTDNAANASTPAFSSTFKYDDTAPEVGLTAPADGSATSDTTPRFTGTTNNGPADVNAVTVSLSGPTPTTLVAPVAADGSWSVSAADQLAPGDYQAQATQTDEVGRNDASPVHTFTVDPALPRVRISNPAHGTVTKNASLTISGTAGVGAAFEPTVKVSIYAGTSSAGAPLLELSAPVSSGVWSTAASPLADGVYTLVAEQSDLAGGTASDSIAVEIDTTPPEPLTGATVVSGYGYVKLHWTRPLSWKTTDKVVITRRRAGSSLVATVYRGVGTLFKDGRVRNGDTYTYTLLPRDAVGNQGVSLSKQARPTGFLAPRHLTHALDPPLVRWVDVSRSTYANIQLYLLTSAGMKKIWSVWPLADKLQLKSRWVYKGRVYRLRADRRYRIYGWPGFGAPSERNYGEWFGWVDFTYR